MNNTARQSFIWAICLLLLGASGSWGSSHIEKAHFLDEYIRKQNQSTYDVALRPQADEAVRKAIASGFRQYNSSVSWKHAWEYAGYVMEACKKFGVEDPTLVAGMIVKESRIRPRARSRYAYGLMQIYWKVHKKSIKRTFPWIKNTEDLMNPRNNVLVGTWIFASYLKNSGNDIHKALHRYLGAHNHRYVSKIMSYRGTIRKNLIADERS